MTVIFLLDFFIFLCIFDWYFTHFSCLELLLCFYDYMLFPRRSLKAGECSLFQSNLSCTCLAGQKKGERNSEGILWMQGPKLGREKTHRFATFV